MEPLPTASTEITQFFHQWLETFAGFVREVDYASARPLFHPDVLAFGTHNDVISGIDQWVATQWDNVWPKTTDFRFILEQTSVLASRDGTVATVIAPWTSTGYHPDGHPRLRVPAGPPWCFRAMPMVGCACIPTCRSTAAYRKRAMPIGGERPGVIAMTASGASRPWRWLDRGTTARCHFPVPAPGTQGLVSGFTLQRGCEMLRRERRPHFRTVDRWATSLLLQAGAIFRCEQHGWAKDRTDPHAREDALCMAREEPLAGLSSEQAVAAVLEVLDSIGDTCPECD